MTAAAAPNGYDQFVGFGLSRFWRDRLREFLAVAQVESTVCRSAPQVRGDQRGPEAQEARVANRAKQAHQGGRDDAGKRALQGKREREVSPARCTAMPP